jgi:hypothetical protein
VPRRWRASIPEDLNRQSGAKQLWLFLASRVRPEEFDQMDSMRNNQFEEEYDGSPVEADVTTLRRAKVAGDSGHDRLEFGVPMRRDGAGATGSIANQVDDSPRSSDPLNAYFRNL